MRSQTLNASRYSNGTLAKIMAETTNFVSYDYKPETNTGTFNPATTRLTPSFSGGITLGGWEYLDGETWKPVVGGEHGFVFSGSALVVSASSDLFGSADAVLTIRLVGSDPEYWDSVTLTREVSPTELYRKANTKITQTDDKIALIASSEELAKYSTTVTLSKNLSTLEQTSAEFRQTVTGSYATKTYANGQASAAQSAAISAAATDATTKANAAETAAKNYTTSELTKYSTITQTDSKISTAVSTKVGETEVKSIIEQEADNIRLKADKIAWESDNSSMTEDGVLTCTGANISGDLSLEKTGGSAYFKDFTIQNYTGAGTATSKNVTGLVIDGGPYYRENFKAIIPWEYGGALEQTIYNKPRQRAYSLNEMYGSSGFAYEQRRATFSDGDYLVLKQLSKVDVSYFYDLGSGNGIREAKGIDTSGNLFYEIRQILGNASPTANSFVMENDEWKFIGDALKFNGADVAVQSSSSRRYKEDISPIDSDELDPHRLYSLEAVQFRYKDGAALQYDDMEGLTIPGFIAEDVAGIYPAAVIHKDGEVESWDERRIIPGMLALIQEQKAEIDELRLEIANIKTEMEALKNEIYR